MFNKYTILVIFLFINSFTSAQAADETEGQNDAEETTTPDIGSVQLLETGDIYAIIQVDVPISRISNDNNTIAFRNVRISYQVEHIENGVQTWVPSDRITGKKWYTTTVNSEVLNGYYRYVINITGIDPISHYNFTVEAYYGPDIFKIGSVEFTTKIAAPKLSLTSQLTRLDFADANAVKYFAKISRVNANGQESDCLLDVTMTPSFGQSLWLPSLTNGESYKIEVWHVDAEGHESVHSFIDHTA